MAVKKKTIKKVTNKTTKKSSKGSITSKTKKKVKCTCDTCDLQLIDKSNELASQIIDLIEKSDLDEVQIMGILDCIKIDLYMYLCDD